MQTVIVMEGADGVGKTNIGQALAKKLGIPYFRMATQHENWRKGQFKTALQFDQTYLTELLRQTGHSMVIDRAWPSEWVYSKVYGRDTDSKLLDELDRAWADMEAWIIIPTRRSFGGVREDDLVKHEDLYRIQNTYEDFYNWTKCNVLMFAVDHQDVNCQIDKELKIINDEFGWWEGQPGVKVRLY